MILAHEEELKQDENQLNDLREQLKELNESNERRVSDLEAKIAQMCLTIADNENNTESSLQTLKKTK